MQMLTRRRMDETDGLSLKAKTVWILMPIEFIADDGTSETILVGAVHT